MVTRARRVQVDPTIPKPAARTYSAVAVPHVGPQRKQSQASNFERLARDLGQFNSALQRFGGAVDAANKRAEARAKKLEAEKKAAEKREARKARAASRRRSGGRKKGRTRAQYLEERRAKFEEDHTIENKSGTEEAAVSGDPGTAKETLGDPNATKQTYKELNEVKAGIGKDVYAEQKANLAEERKAGFRVAEEDEHGEPEMGPDGKPKTRLITEYEIHHEAYKQQKAIDEKWGDKPLVRRHLKFQNVKNMEARMKGLKAAEEAERKTEALQFAANTVGDTVKGMHQQGFDPDTISRAAQAKALADVRVLYPNASRDQVDKMMIKGIEDTLGSGDIEDARAAIMFLQGSPDKDNGVAPWITHKKHADHAKRIIGKASKIVAENQANTKKMKVVKDFIVAHISGSGKFPNIKEIKETLNGKTHRISEAELRSSIGEMVDQSILSHTDPETGETVPIPEEKRAAMIPQLIDQYQGLPNLESPALKRALAFQVKRGEEINPNDPAFGPSAAVAMTMMQKGAGGAAMLKRHVGPTMYRFYEQLWAMRRNGLVEEDEVIPMMNTWLKHARTGGQRPTLGSMENKLTHLPMPGLTKTQREQVMNTARLAVIDKGLPYEEVAKIMLDQAETFREYNPQYNGVTVEMDPSLQMTPEQFTFLIDQDVRSFRQATGYDKDVYVERVGNMYYYHDKETGEPILRPPLNKRVGFTREKLMQRQEIMKARLEKYQDAVTAEDKRYREAGGNWGAFLRFTGWQEALDSTPESQLIEKHEAEMAEFEKIVNERE